MSARILSMILHSVEAAKDIHKMMTMGKRSFCWLLVDQGPGQCCCPWSECALTTAADSTTYLVRDDNVRYG